MWYDYVFVFISLIVIILALLQGGKSEGASGAITGGGLNVFAKTKERGSEKVVSYLTFAFAILWLFFAILIMVLSSVSETTDEETTEEAAAAIMILANYFI